MDFTPIEFDSGDFIEVPVAIKGKGDFLLREASREAAGKYSSHMIEGTKFKSGEPDRFVGFGHADTVLLGNCLYKKGENVAVGEVFAANLPERIADVLVKRLKTISRINQPTTKKEITDKQMELKRQLEEMDKKEAGEGPLEKGAS